MISIKKYEKVERTVRTVGAISAVTGLSLVAIGYLKPSTKLNTPITILYGISCFCAGFILCENING